MPNPIPTRTSFKKGHKFRPEIYEKRRQTILRQYKLGLRKPPKPNWTPELKSQMVERNRQNCLKRRPIGTRRLQNAGLGFKYWVIKVSDRGPWQYEHRIMMEKMIGRPLRKKDNVHHKNHDTLDNRPENLILMTASEHSAHHGKKRLRNLKFINSRKLPIGKWSIHFDACIDCNTNKTPHKGHGRCNNCNERWRRKT